MNDFGFIQQNNSNKYLNILDEDLELIGEVPEPSNIIWKNLYMEPWRLLLNNILADIILFVILLSILVIFITVKSNASFVTKKYTTDNDCSNYQNIDTVEHFKEVALHDKYMTDQ